MKISSESLTFFGSVLLLWLSFSPTANRVTGSEFRVGIAKIDSTPAPGVSLDGPISKPGPAKGVHDPLHVRALVLANSKTKLALVVCDNCIVGQDVVDAAKRRVHQESGIPPENVLVAATHTHAAPRAVHIGTSAQDDEYHRSLASNIAKAILWAEQRLEPAQMGFATFERPDLLKCRRVLCSPGTVSASPFGAADEEVKSVAGSSRAELGPAGPVDPEFSVMEFRRLDGTTICIVGNFSVHYCGGYSGGLISADYFGYFCEAIESVSQTQPILGMMFNGTSGDTGSFTRTGKQYASFEAMQVYGRELASQARAATQNVAFKNDIEIEMVQSRIQVGIRKPDSERLAWARETLAASREKKLPHRWSRIYANEAKFLAEYPNSIDLTLQALRVGDIAITANPCEMFASTGLAIKADSPFKDTFNIELANGYGGYLPPVEQHRLGGYETWPARSSFLEVPAEVKIRQELLRLLEEL